MSLVEAFHGGRPAMRACRERKRRGRVRGAGARRAGCMERRKGCHGGKLGEEGSSASGRLLSCFQGSFIFLSSVR
jgi:hypothetical protein